MSSSCENGSTHISNALKIVAHFGKGMMAISELHATEVRCDNICDGHFVFRECSRFIRTDDIHTAQCFHLFKMEIHKECPRLPLSIWSNIHVSISINNKETDIFIVAEKNSTRLLEEISVRLYHSQWEASLRSLCGWPFSSLQVPM